MKKIFSFASLLLIYTGLFAQNNAPVIAVKNSSTSTDTSINKVDKNGLRQGFWRETRAI